MGCIVVSMPKEENALRIKEIIKSSGLWEDILICRHGADVLHVVSNQDVSLVVCTSKLGDMGYEELSGYLPSYVSIVLLTKNATLVPFSSNIIKLLMPFKAQDLISTIRTMMPDEFYSKKKKPVRSKEEQDTIDEAKRMLMERNDMTEPEAFRYLQKISMDAGRKLVETAEMFLYLNGRT